MKVTTALLLVFCFVGGSVAVPRIHPVSLRKTSNEELKSKNRLGNVRNPLVGRSGDAAGVRKHDDAPLSPADNTISRVRGGSSNTLQTALLGSVVLAGIEKGVKELLKALDIKFPAMLGGCLLLFFSLLATETVNPSLANSVSDFLTPAAGLLTRWLPMFFVPGLALLPLAPSIGDFFEISKVVSVVVLGLLYTILTTTYSVMLLRGGKIKLSLDKAKAGKSKAAAKPFNAKTLNIFAVVALVSGVLNLILANQGGSLAKPSQTVFLTSFTVATYIWAARLPSSFVKVVHPLVTTCLLILGVVRLLASLTGTSYLHILREYKVGSLNLSKAGSGDLLLYCLGPSAVSFAVSMYSRRNLLKANFAVVATAMFVSSVGGLFGTAAFVRAIRLGGNFGDKVRLSVLSRNVTTALAIALTAMIGGDLSIAAAVVCMTGVVGATYGKSIMSALGVSDPVTRGLAIGASSQGLGVASMVDEPDAFPFAASSMVLTAVCSTTLVAIPAVKKALIKLATGKSFHI